MPELQFVIRKTLGGGFSVYVRGNEIAYITPKEAAQARSKVELLGDMARRLQLPKSRGGITDEESGIIMEALGKMLS